MTDILKEWEDYKKGKEESIIEYSLYRVCGLWYVIILFVTWPIWWPLFMMYEVFKKDPERDERIAKKIKEEDNDGRVKNTRKYDI